MRSKTELTIDELSPITHALTDLVARADPRAAEAALILLSVVTGTSDADMLDVPLTATAELWLDVGQCCWAWDFNAYKGAGRADLPESERCPVWVPMPAPVSDYLRDQYARRPAASCVRELLGWVGVDDDEHLGTARRLAARYGDPIHPPRRGRLARSLSHIVLEESGSDMLPALTVAHFAPAAPAALYYYAPEAGRVCDVLTAVYRRLGMGAPRPMPSHITRLGYATVLDPADTQAGWSRHVDQLDGERHAAFELVSSQAVIDSIITAANRWMISLAAALIVQTAHRCTRLECVTWGALYGHLDVMLIRDKDLGDRAPPRC